MTARLFAITALAGALATVAGCQSMQRMNADNRSFLAGTEWRVIEIVEPDEEDMSTLAQADEVLITFRPNGQLVTTMLMDDGSVAVNTDERYSVNGEVVTITGPDYEYKAMYRMEGDDLRLHSPYSILLMRPIRGMAAAG